MTIIVQCECGRTLRAPDQMAGRDANCVCGKTVPLKLDARLRQLEAVEPEFGEPDGDTAPPPIVVKRRSAKKVSPKVSDSKKSLFRPTVGRNVERGAADDPAPNVPGPSPKKKRRRQDKATFTERKRQTLEGFIPGLIRSLKFPLRTESLFAIGLMAIIYGIFTSVMGFMLFAAMNLRMMVIMFLGTLVILGYFFYFLLQIFRLASIDEDDMPVAMEFDFDQILGDLWTWVGTVWWSGLPMAAYWMTISRLVRWGYLEHFEWVPWTVAPGLILCLLPFPMALISSALHATVLAANPWTVMRGIFRVPLEYFATLCVFGCLCITAVVIGLVIPRFPSSIPVFSEILAWALEFYALTASAYGFGNFYYRNRLKIGWFGELPRQL